MYIDPVTKVLNRKAFEHASYNQIAIVDMDSLKWINDNIGHEEGDRYLARLASYLVENFGDSNVFRLGGDEFGVISQDPIRNVEFCCRVIAACDSNRTFSFGIGETLAKADLDLNTSKSIREDLGLRSGRGDCPPWIQTNISNVIDFIGAVKRLNNV